MIEHVTCISLDAETRMFTVGKTYAVTKDPQGMLHTLIDDLGHARSLLIEKGCARFVLQSADRYARDTPYAQFKTLQTYAEYRVTMSAYNFSPLPEDVWRDWQLHYHGTYAT